MTIMYENYLLLSTRGVEPDSFGVKSMTCLVKKNQTFTGCQKQLISFVDQLCWGHRMLTHLHQNELKPKH